MRHVWLSSVGLARRDPRLARDEHGPGRAHVRHLDGVRVRGRVRAGLRVIG